MKHFWSEISLTTPSESEWLALTQNDSFRIHNSLLFCYGYIGYNQCCRKVFISSRACLHGNKYFLSDRRSRKKSLSTPFAEMDRSRSPKIRTECSQNALLTRPDPQKALIPSQRGVNTLNLVTAVSSGRGIRVCRTSFAATVRYVQEKQQPGWKSARHTPHRRHSKLF